MAENTFDYSTLSQPVNRKKDGEEEEDKVVSPITLSEPDVTSSAPSPTSNNSFDYTTLSRSVEGTVLNIEPILDTSTSTTRIEPVLEEESSDPTGLSGRLQEAWENLTGPVEDQPVAASNLRGFIDPFSQMPGFFKGENEGERRAELTAKGSVGKGREAKLLKKANEAGYEDVDLYIEEKLAPTMVKEFRGVGTKTERIDPVTGEVRVSTGKAGRPSPIMAKMLEIAPVWGYKALMVASDAISIGVANTQDLIEDKVTELQADDPKTYDKLNNAVAGNFANIVGLGSKKVQVDNSPRQLANSISDAIGGGLEFSETLPFVGAIGRVKVSQKKRTGRQLRM